MNLNGKDYVFQKANGDAEWWNGNCVVKNLFLYFLTFQGYDGAISSVVDVYLRFFKFRIICFI